MFAFCTENACTKRELLDELKANGTVDPNDTLDDLSAYVDGKTYEEMRQFLEENV